MVAIVAAAVGSLLTLKHVGERAVAGERDLTGVRAGLLEHDAEQWRALSGRYPVPAIATRQRAVREHMIALLAQARREGMDAQDGRRLTAAIDDYETAADSELTLLAGGRRAEAILLDQVQGAPAFRVAAEAIHDSISDIERSGRRARWLSDIGLAAIVVLAFGAVAVLERRRRQVERRRRAEAAYQATHDALTGLPNRVLFFDRLRDAVARAGWNGSETSLLYVDLDDFKGVNDSLGHRAGDDVLVVAADRMGGVLRSGYLLARLGGDEFAILLEGTRPDEAQAVAARLVEVLSDEVTLDGQRLRLSASVGLASLSDVDAETGAEIGLLTVADLALYAAKAEGKSRCLRYAPEMSERASRRRQLEDGLRAALDGSKQDRVHVVYQPVVRLGDGGISGVEALARFDSATLGTVSPAEFIPLAEETGLILALGGLVLRHACETLRAWHLEFSGRLPITLSVNVSARQPADPGFVADVRRVLEETGLPAALLTLEITESQAVSRDCLPTLLALKALGLRLAVDDFGTGYASLAQLEMLPLDTIKIDRSFVSAIDDGNARAHIVTGVLRLAHDLGLDTIAEGVETVEQRDQLVELGCPLAQGFYFSRPLAADDLRSLLAERSAVAASPIAEVRR